MIEEVLPYTDCSLLILCGGSSRRMGGQDKGIKDVHGKPMIKHLTDQFSSLFSDIVISCNRHIDEYAKLGFKLVQDPDEDMGPLGGILAATNTCTNDYLATVPCDTPFISAPVYDRLIEAAKSSRLPVVVANDGNRQQMLHAVFNLRDFDLKQSLETFLTTDKAVKNWYPAIGIREINCSDFAEQFININSMQDLDKLD